MPLFLDQPQPFVIQFLRFSNYTLIGSELKYLLGLLVGFEILDGIMSHFLIRGGLAREGNPFLLPLVGETNFLVIKVVGVFICALILWDIYKRARKLALISASIFVTFYGGLVLWNSGLFFVARI